MPTVDDVAAYILEKQGSITTWKLQKLVYYCQAWHLVWQEKPLFRAKIEAWANGPVVPALYKQHRGRFEVAAWPTGDAGKLSADQKETVDAVLAFYGDKTSQWLSDLTHGEAPWNTARGSLPAGERGNQEITLESMLGYYSGLGG